MKFTLVIIEAVLSTVQHITMLKHVPDKVLDQVVAERIRDIPARQLVTTLAKARRLGYQEDDLIDEEDESVYPNQVLDTDNVVMTDAAQSPQQRAMTQQHQTSKPGLALPDTDPLLAEQERNLEILRNTPIEKAPKPRKGPKPLKGGLLTAPCKLF